MARVFAQIIEMNISWVLAQSILGHSDAGKTKLLSYKSAISSRYQAPGDPGSLAGKRTSISSEKLVGGKARSGSGEIAISSISPELEFHQLGPRRLQPVSKIALPVRCDRL